MTELLVYLTALAALVTWLSWLARDACQHPEWIDIGDGDAVCTSCDELLRTEDVR